MIFTHGTLSEASKIAIKNVLSAMPFSEDAPGVPDPDQANRRMRVMLYLILGSPDYLINR
jgi:hypothetical protein